MKRLVLLLSFTAAAVGCSKQQAPSTAPEAPVAEASTTEMATAIAPDAQRAKLLVLKFHSDN